MSHSLLKRHSRHQKSIPDPMHEPSGYRGEVGAPNASRGWKWLQSAPFRFELLVSNGKTGPVKRVNVDIHEGRLLPSAASRLQNAPYGLHGW